MGTLSRGFRDDLLRAARMVAVDRGQVYVDGDPVGPIGGDLEAAVASALYTHWFASADLSWWSASPDIPVDPTLLARLRAAHVATTQFEDGWWAAAVGPAGDVDAASEERWLRLAPPDYVNLSRRAVAARPGDLIAVTRRRDVADTWTGWWLTTGTAGAAPDEAMIRIYWNCGPDAVGELVRGLTALLEGLEVPYTFKCPIHPILFRRTDSVVLYLGRVAWEEVKPWLRDVHSRLGERLRPAVPPLTLRLGAGIAVAEDPGNAESFGQSRAAAVAAGLVRLLPGPLPDDDAVLSTIGGALEAHGISVSRPYLNAGAVEHVLSW